MCTLRKQKASLKNREIKEVRLLSEYYSRHGMIQRRDIKGDYILSGQKDWMKSECRYPYVKEKQLAGLLSHRDYQTRKVTEQKRWLPHQCLGNLVLCYFPVVGIGPAH